MSKRLLCSALLALVISGSSGCRCICCLHDNLLTAYRSHRWFGCGCGETYVDPWHNDPPDCWDPCDDCGNFTGRRWWKSGCNQGDYQGGYGYAGPNAGQGMSGEMGAADGGEIRDEAVRPSEEIPTPAAPRRSQPRTYGPPQSSPPRVGHRSRRMPRPDQEPNLDFDQDLSLARPQPSTASYRR